MLLSMECVHVMICGVLSDPKLFKLYFVNGKGAVNIALIQNSK